MHGHNSPARGRDGTDKAIRELLVRGDVGLLRQRGRMLGQGVRAGTRETLRRARDRLHPCCLQSWEHTGSHSWVLNPLVPHSLREMGDRDSSWTASISSATTPPPSPPDWLGQSHLLVKGCQPSGYSRRTVFPLHAAPPETARLVCQGLFPPLCSSSTMTKGSRHHRQLISSRMESGLALAKPGTTCTRVKLRFPALFLLPRKHVLTPRSLIYLRSHHVQLIPLGNKHEEAAAQAGTPANKQHLCHSQPRGEDPVPWAPFHQGKACFDPAVT